MSEEISSKNFLQISVSQPLYMGVLNLTPDSFSDGNPQASLKDQLIFAEKLIKQGMHILDIGGESTRPQAQLVSAEIEQQRILPFLKEFRKNFPHFPVSVDTQKYEVAQAAADVGIQILNDVSFFSDVRFAHLSKNYGLHYVLMHSNGAGTAAPQNQHYPLGVANEIHTAFLQKIEAFLKNGGQKQKLILDLGFGFAKNQEQCWELWESLPRWKNLGLPLLLGISRKSFLTKITGNIPPKDRDLISAQMACQAYAQGFSMIRCHNIELTHSLFTKIKTPKKT